MRPNYSVFIFLLLSTLPLAAFCDNENDTQAIVVENGDGHAATVELPKAIPTGAAESSKSMAGDTAPPGGSTESAGPAAPTRPKVNPYMALQYKRSGDTGQQAGTDKPAEGTEPVPSSSADQVPEQQTEVMPLASPVDKDTDAAEYYACPMHPAVVSDHEGICPICGMHLVKQHKHVHHVDDSSSVRLASGIIQKIGVRTTAVARGSLRKSLKTGGYVSYNKDRLTSVTSRTYGWVENLSLRRAGMMVKRGELLMELYAPEYLDVQKAFLKAQKIDKSAGQLKKYAERDETVPSRDYMRYLQIPESAINELTRTGKPRLRIPIYAPHYGEVVSLDVKKFSYVNEGDSMLTIADLSSVWVEVNVFQQQLEWLRRNQKAEIIVDVLPGERLAARVSYIDPELDPRTHTARVRLLVANPDFVLRPNMYAQVEIFDDAQQDILKIPSEALIETGDRTSVIKALGNGLFMPVDVVAGFHAGGEVEIKTGLEEGDLVVTSGQFLIDSEANLQASFRRLGHSHEAVQSEPAVETNNPGSE